jgi:tRNA uridine 5-carboxymethylaminomethyl modification enzyme
MTSRAEYRLLLRQDNADLRLRAKGYEVGLISQEKYDDLLNKQELIVKEVERLKNTKVGANPTIQAFMEKNDSTPLKTATSLAELICRPEFNYDNIEEIDPERQELPAAVKEQVEITIRYEGYIGRQLRQVEQFKKLEKKLIPADIDYSDVSSLRIEARQKLEKFRPTNIGQASRIGGVNPADITVLVIYLDSLKRGQSNEN